MTRTQRELGHIEDRLASEGWPWDEALSLLVDSFIAALEEAGA